MAARYPEEHGNFEDLALTYHDMLIRAHVMAKIHWRRIRGAERAARKLVRDDRRNYDLMRRLGALARKYGRRASLFDFAYAALDETELRAVLGLPPTEVPWAIGRVVAVYGVRRVIGLVLDQAREHILVRELVSGEERWHSSVWRCRPAICEPADLMTYAGAWGEAFTILVDRRWDFDRPVAVAEGLRREWFARRLRPARASVEELEALARRFRG